MTVALPSVGAVIRVKTRHQNTYELDWQTIPFVEKIYEGRVVPNDRFDKVTTFCMTGDEHVAVRNIAIENVVSIDYIKGKPAKTQVVRKFHVKSSNGKKEYVVEVVGDKIRCSCPGNIYHGKCKHADAVREKIK
jgi:hypothetical protein